MANSSLEREALEAHGGVSEEAQSVDWQSLVALRHYTGTAPILPSLTRPPFEPPAFRATTGAAGRGAAPPLSGSDRAAPPNRRIW